MKAAEMRELSQNELEAKVVDLRGELFHSRVRHATGQLENTALLRSLRKDIARLETLLREKSGDQA